MVTDYLSFITLLKNNFLKGLHLKNFLEQIEKINDKKYCYKEIYINLENNIDVEKENAKLKMKKLATSYIIKIEKKFKDLPLLVDLSKLNLKSIKKLKESELSDWGNESIRKLVVHFERLNSNHLEKIFEENPMIEQYKLLKTMVNFEWKCLSIEEILIRVMSFI